MSSAAPLMVAPRAQQNRDLSGWNRSNPHTARRSQRAQVFVMVTLMDIYTDIYVSGPKLYFTVAFMIIVCIQGRRVHSGWSLFRACEVAGKNAGKLFETLNPKPSEVAGKNAGQPF